jgi:hypothetical protein
MIAVLIDSQGNVIDGCTCPLELPITTSNAILFHYLQQIKQKGDKMIGLLSNDFERKDKNVNLTLNFVQSTSL